MFVPYNQPISVQMWATLCPLIINLCHSILWPTHTKGNWSNSKNFNPILGLSPPTERLILKQHGKPNGNSINGHPARKFLHMWKFYKSVPKARSPSLATLVQHLILGPQTLKFHKLDLYSHRQHFLQNKKDSVDLFTGPQLSSNSWVNGLVLKCCT